MRPVKCLLLFLGVFVIIPNKLIAKHISYDFSSEEEDYLTVLSAWFYSAFDTGDIDSSDSSESNETYLICRNCTVILGKAAESRPTIESTKVAASTVATEIVGSKETTPAAKSIGDTTTPMASKATTAVAGKEVTTTGATGATMTTAAA